jgi:hypothetical protein
MGYGMEEAVQSRDIQHINTFHTDAVPDAVT